MPARLELGPIRDFVPTRLDLDPIRDYPPSLSSGNTSFEAIESPSTHNSGQKRSNKITRLLQPFGCKMLIHSSLSRLGGRSLAS